jgi:anti-sigma28 factor (negative regulator of flagellin synthesis)
MHIPSRVYNSPDIAAQTDQARKLKSQQAKKSGSTDAAKRTKGDVKVSVSARARKLAGENSMDIEKINRLRESIENGSFAMDFQLVAERIVERG